MKDKILLNSKAKLFICLICVFIISAVCWLLFNLCIYQEKKYNMNDYIREENLHDFSLENGVITSTSWDPWITLSFENDQFVKTVDIEITDISQDDVTATIFASGHTWVGKPLKLEAGINSVSFQWSWDNLSYLRLDLAEKTDVSMKVQNVVINARSKILEIALKQSFVAGILMVLLFVVLMLCRSRFFESKGQMVLAKGRVFAVSFYNNEKMERIFSLIVKCWLVYTISILAIIRADFRYIDDIGRTYTGSVSDWDVYSRYFAEILCKWLSAGNIVTDTSPLTQIITMLFMAIAVSIIIWAVSPEKLASNWLVVAAVPFAISPYFMENISYKIECIIHGGSVLLSVFPVLFYKKKRLAYGAVIAVCITLMCVTYQAASGIFPVVVIMIAATQWNKGEELKEVWKFLSTSAVGYVVGVCIFKIFIMSPVSTHVSSDIFSLKEIIPGFFNNLLTFYAVFYHDFKASWKIIILIIVITYIIVYSSSSKRGPVISGAVAIFSIILMCCLCFGIYPVLRNCIYLPRSMYGINIALGMICIFIVSQGLFLSKATVLSIAWCFVVFAFEYGNCLVLQQEYTNVKVQTVINYLNEHYDEDKQYTLQLDGDINKAPAVQNQIKNSPLLNKLVPSSFGGGWNWREYKLYRYYGLPSNYTVVWAWERNNDLEKDLFQKNLPLSDSLMWFDVYSDGSQILIQMKN